MQQVIHQNPNLLVERLLLSLSQNFIGSLLILPFIDGNDSAIRSLMNNNPIVVLPPTCRSEYISALQKKQKNPNVFMQFTMERVMEAQRDYI